ncbi:histidine kinase N-terminal 7TM domain-containing protein [Halapricum desulfuricans]|uniref:histidine kinase n=1 Tax=Halapricum desulfuricans TaxID=2841257 RepID=A0A897NC35_9EURY|nr:histidine kinase N-terminal 7TM domain-containing protein [Halapricum desulfuricans]QSG10247.1 Signal transduction histidine kinase, contains PAS domain [Halapricum desulfuricans]
MAWQFSPYLILLFFAAIVAVGWALYGAHTVPFQEWDYQIGGFVVLNLAVAVWTSVYGIQIASTTLGTKLLAYKLLHIGGVTVPLAWFVFSLGYGGLEDRLSLLRIGGLAVIPATLLVTLPTNPESLALASITLRRSGDIFLLDVQHGPVYALFLSYSYVLLLSGGYVLVRTGLRQNRVFRGASSLLLVGVAVPFVVNLVHVFGLQPSGINYTPISLSISAFLFGVAVFRYRVHDLTPIAREETFESIQEGIVVFDSNDRVVDLNPAAKAILALDSTAIGRPGSDVLPQYEELGDTDQESRELTVERGETTRIVEMRQSSITADTTHGHIVVLQDITERREYIQRIERQNERLDAFASVVAHDLRNPLSVISGHTKLAEETDDPEHFDTINDAVKRMDSLLENMLTLARQGEAIDDPEEVCLDTIADKAWSVVETGDATLSTRTELRIEADPEGLQQIFENLFRNAIDHVGEDVTVVVGALPTGGFYVEDDGPGIPEDDRDRVFSAGYSTGEGGTGLGLNIVAELVEAHGWTISVTDGPDGGCRFEITDIQTVGKATTGQQKAYRYPQ